MTPKEMTGHIYTAFPEGHYKRKKGFDVSQTDPGRALVEVKLDFDPDVEIINSQSFAFNVKFIVSSEMFEIELHLYQRVDYNEPFDIKESLRRNPDTFKGVMFNALPHAAKTIYQFVLNMGMKYELKNIEEQLKKCISDLGKTTEH